VEIERFGVGKRLTDFIVHGDKIHFSGYVAEGAAGKSVTEQTRDILAQIDNSLAEVGSNKSKLIACCLTKECSRADCSLPHANVPHAHAGARAVDGTGSGLGDPALPNTSARAISPRQTFRRRWTVRSRWSG
jgi:hypothetical protein